MVRKPIHHNDTTKGNDIIAFNSHTKTNQATSLGLLFNFNSVLLKDGFKRIVR